MSFMKNFPSFSLFLHRWPACCVSWSHYVSKEEFDVIGLLKICQKYSLELLVMKAEYNVVALSSWKWYSGTLEGLLYFTL